MTKLDNDVRFDAVSWGTRCSYHSFQVQKLCCVTPQKCTVSDVQFTMHHRC